MNDRVTAIKFFNDARAIPVQPQYNGSPQLQYQLFSSAVMADPTMGLGVYELANANRDLGLKEAAITGYRLLLDLPEGDVPGDVTREIKARALVNMAHCLYSLGRHQESEDCSLMALEINKNLSQGWLNLSLVQSVTDRLDESLESAQRAFELEPDSPVIETGLAFAYLYKQDFATGLRHFEARFPYRLQHFMSYPYPKWSGEEGATVYLVSEQGLGDALSFARFVEMAALRCKFIHIVVQKELTRLLKTSLQHVQNINIMGSPQPFYPADYWTTFMSLPTALGLTTEEFINTPNIKIPRFAVNPSWKNPNAKLHIGVAWSGSPASDINHWRSFPVTQFLEFYKVPGIQLYSIQTNDQAKELHAAGCSVLIRDLSPLIGDVCDTMGIMTQLDLVITTESAPGHIAGSVGVETWVPYSKFGRDWRASHDGKTPIWYKNHRFFRQGDDATWPPVFKKIADALREKINAA